MVRPACALSARWTKRTHGRQRVCCSHTSFRTSSMRAHTWRVPKVPKRSATTTQLPTIAVFATRRGRNRFLRASSWDKGTSLLSPALHDRAHVDPLLAIPLPCGRCPMPGGTPKPPVPAQQRARFETRRAGQCRDSSRFDVRLALMGRSRGQPRALVARRTTQGCLAKSNAPCQKTMTMMLFVTLFGAKHVLPSRTALLQSTVLNVPLSWQTFICV